MPVERHTLTAGEVRFEIGFAVGQVPRSVWVRVRGKDRLASDAAIEQVVAAVAERFRALEVVRQHDTAKTDWRMIGNGLGRPADEPPGSCGQSDADRPNDWE